MSRLKTIVRNQRGVQPLRGGHSLCQGCGIPMVARTVLSTIRQPVVVVNATGCLEVATTRDRKSTRLNSSHYALSRMPSSA